MEFILGSASPRRKAILSSLIGDITVLHPEVDESVSPGESPVVYVQRIVNKKMNYITSKYREEGLYLTADTVVTIDGKILGKPSSYHDAILMLKSLSGREHNVITGLSLALKRKNFIINDIGYEVSSVFFKKLEENDILKYLSFVNYTDKAGAYAIQENGDMIIESVSGSVTNVIGLPVRLFLKMMNEMDVLKYYF